MTIHPEYASLVAKLDRLSILNCCLRDDLASGCLLDDLDLLVEDRHFSKVLEIMIADGYRVRVSETHIPGKTSLSKLKDGQFVTIDLHRNLIQDGIIYLDSSDVLHRAQRRRGYWIPAADDLLIILIVHNLIGKNAIQTKHLQLLRDLFSSVGTKGIAQRLAGRSSAGTIIGALERMEACHASPAAASAMASALRKALIREDPGSRARILRRDLHRFARRWSLRQYAPIYAVIGPDGAGKSTLIAHLLKALNGTGGFRAATIYMGPWGHYRLNTDLGAPYVPGWNLTTREWIRAMSPVHGESRPSLAEVGRALVWSPKRSDSKFEDGEYDRIRNRSRIFLTLRYVRSIYTLIRFFSLLSVETSIRLIVSYRARRRGTIVIADRYTYDLMTGQMHQITVAYNRLRSFFCRLVPRPTRTFLLQSDDAIILSRKSDLTSETLRQFVETYDRLARQYGFDRIDSTRPPTVIADEIVSIIFDQICKRLRR